MIQEISDVLIDIWQYNNCIIPLTVISSLCQLQQSRTKSHFCLMIMKILAMRYLSPPKTKGIIPCKSYKDKWQYMPDIKLIGNALFTYAKYCLFKHLGYSFKQHASPTFSITWLILLAWASVCLLEHTHLPKHCLCSFKQAFSMLVPCSCTLARPSTSHVHPNSCLSIICPQIFQEEI